MNTLAVLVGIVATGILALFFYQTVGSVTGGALVLLAGLLLLVWLYNAIQDDTTIASGGHVDDED